MDLGGLGDKAKDFANDNPDKVNEGLDKAGDAANDRTGGQHEDKINQGKDSLKDKFGGNGEN